MVGDTEPVPLSDRPEFAALAVGSLADRVAAAARMLTGINQRTLGSAPRARRGGGGDPLLAAKATELQSRRRDNVRQGAGARRGRGVDDDVVDALWVVMDADAFQLLTETGGRTVEEYERWLAATISRLLERP